MLGVKKADTISTITEDVNPGHEGIACTYPTTGGWDKIVLSTTIIARARQPSVSVGGNQTFTSDRINQAAALSDDNFIVRETSGR